MPGDLKSESTYMNVGHLVRLQSAWERGLLCLDIISAVRVYRYDQLLQVIFSGRPEAVLLVAYSAQLGSRICGLVFNRIKFDS